jgi:hypothetical protein
MKGRRFSRKSFFMNGASACRTGEIKLREKNYMSQKGSSHGQKPREEPIEHEDYTYEI